MYFFVYLRTKHLMAVTYIYNYSFYFVCLINVFLKVSNLAQSVFNKYLQM